MPLPANWTDGGTTFHASDENAVEVAVNANTTAIATKVPWSGGTAGILPATSGQHLTTQGGNTLDNGSGAVTILGGTLDGVTIGSTTPAVSINAKALVATQNVTLSGTQKPWLAQTGAIGGTLSGFGAMNYLALNDTVAGGNNWLYGLQVVDNVLTPATGLRNAIYGHVIGTSVGTNTKNQAQWVGVAGRAENNVGFPGAASGTAGIGTYWGGWFFGAINGGTYHDGVYGIEIDTVVLSGVSVNTKIGLLITTGPTDAVRGTTDDIALSIGTSGGSSATWRNGLMFGRDQAIGTGAQGNNWPFDNTSTIIGLSAPGTAGNPANIGLDLSTATFTDCAIKTGPAPIQMGAMASAPSTPVSGKGKLYIASDGSLHYLGSTTDTQLAPA